MCTLIVLHRCVPGISFAVGANRDEFFNRPTEGLALRRTEYGAIVAPRDVRGGGTWLGLNAYGLFAAVTNRPCAAPDPGRRSRGLLVADALQAQSADQAAERFEDLEIEAYNPFNLLLADRDEVRAITYDGAPRQDVLAPGAIVIGNADPADPTPKLKRIAERARRAAAAPAEKVLDELAEICRSHDGAGDLLQDACVHTDRYGTRSSTLLRIGEDRTDCELRYTDGAPCTTDYKDFTPLLQELGVHIQLTEGETVMRKNS